MGSIYYIVFPLCVLRADCESFDLRFMYSRPIRPEIKFPQQLQTPKPYFNENRKVVWEIPHDDTHTFTSYKGDIRIIISVTYMKMFH